MATPGSAAPGASLQAPGTDLRHAATSSQPTPRPELGYYVGFRQPPASAQRRSSLAPSVRQLDVAASGGVWASRVARGSGAPAGALAACRASAAGPDAAPAHLPPPQDSLAVSDEGDGDAEATYIWGTNLSVSRVQSRFNAFVRTFHEPDQADPKYMQLLTEVRGRVAAWGCVQGVWG